MIKQNEKNKTINQNENGVALAGAAIAMTIALGLVIGLVVSVISTQSDISDTDTSQRVLAAAEGGAETFLSLDAKKLERWTDDSDGMGGNRKAICEDDLKGKYDIGSPEYCVFTFTPTANDDIQAQATVSLEAYNESHGKKGSIFEFQLQPGGMREIRLDDYFNKDLAVCWNNQDPESKEMAKDLGIYVIANNSDTGKFSKVLIKCKDGIDCPGWELPSGIVGEVLLPPIVESEAPREGEYPDHYSCFYGLGDYVTKVGPGSDKRLRVYAVSGPAGGANVATVGLIAEKDSKFPEQGYKITSIGKLTTPSPIQIEKKVTVYRSHPYLPGLFDFALYAEGLADVQN
jgi:hypothetical protein